MGKQKEEKKEKKRERKTRNKGRECEKINRGSVVRSG